MNSKFMSDNIIITLLIIYSGITFLLVGCSNNKYNDYIKIEKGVSQLFIDDYLIESHENLKRTLHQPAKDNNGEKPVIAIENEFEGLNATLEANGTIVYDPRIEKYVMFALGYSRHWREVKKRRWDSVRLYRFTSKDGINWVKGDNGIPQWVFPRTKKDLYDPKSNSYATNVDLFSCYYDKTDPVYPYKGWQHFSNWGDDREGQYYLHSKEGIYWERGPMVVNAYEKADNPNNYRIEQNGRTLTGPGDVTTFYYDEKEDRYLGIFKFRSVELVEYDNQLRSRAYSFFKHALNQEFDLEKIQHVELVPPAAENNGDLPYDEYYASTGWRYESLWLGGLKIWHSGGDYPWSAAGSAFLKLIVSRDGLHWSKVQFENENGIKEVFIPNGKEGGNDAKNDGGYLSEFSQGPLNINNELIFYYGCSSYGKNHPNTIAMSGGGIFRARLRVDGFVSVDNGTFTTKLLRAKGKNLYINSKGNVLVELLNENNDVISKQIVVDDSIEQLVLFDAKSLGDLIDGNFFKLRFTVEENGELYSFNVND